ncbi:hypothetical protein [Rhodopseudomonas palustris]|uniref:hypothetical protein n=1 Tax=Rhodopseudomonas palustris TaxID=1076 RepID=UPI0014024565|nr:hypothetical protein [Rhodopseudomonas palustris]
MSNQNQQKPTPSQTSAGQQQQGGGARPGRQQQDPGRPGNAPDRQQGGQQHGGQGR